MKFNDKYEYTPMSAGELARCIDDTGLSLGQVCRLLGVDYDWLKGALQTKDTADVPHLMRLVFLLMAATPNGVQLCRQMTDVVAEKTMDFNMDKKHSNERGHGKRAPVDVKGGILPRS